MEAFAVIGLIVVFAVVLTPVVVFWGITACIVKLTWDDRKKTKGDGS